MFSLRQLRRFLLVLSFSSVMFGYTTVKTLNNIRFADQYAWSQTLSTAITVGANTVTLSPCPSGVNGTDIAPTPHWLYLTSGTGDSSPSEPVLITGGSCVGAALSGTVTFVAAFSHCISGHSGCTSSVSIGTATGGAQEAERDAGTANANVNNWIILAPGMTFQFNAPLFLSQSSISLGGNGSNVKCNLLNRCIMMGDTASSVTWVGQRIEALQITPGTPIWSSPIFPSSPSSIATPAPAGTAPNPGTSASISSITGNGSNAMVTTSGTQPFIVGETVTIIGSNVPGYNVTTTILTATSSSFTFSSSITTTAGPYGFAALPLTLTFSASSPCPSSFYPQIPNQVLWLAGTGPGAGSAPTAGDPTTPYGIGEFVNVLGGTCAPTGTGTIVIAQGTPGLTQLNAHGSGYSLSNTVSPGIEDNAEGSDLENIYFRSANSGAVRFGSGIQIDNDQAAVIHALEFNSGDAPILHCGQWYCGNAVFSPGPEGLNSGIAYISDSNLEMGGSGRGNCIGWWSGNDLHFEKSVCQSYSRWGIKINQDRGGYGHITLGPNVHFENGSVTNPLGNVGIPTVIMAGNSLTSFDSEIYAVADTVGHGASIPEFLSVSGASNTQYYYVVAQIPPSTGSGALCAASLCLSLPLPAGLAEVTDPSVNTVPVTFNAIAGATAYDILRITTTGTKFANPPIAPWGGNCDGMGGDGKCAIATNVLPGTPTGQWLGCNSYGLCQFNDNVLVASTFSYTTHNKADATSWAPMLNDWPGGVILTNGSQQGQPGAESAYYYGPNSCMVSEEPLDSNQSIFFRGGGVGTCMAQAVIPYFPAYSFGTSGFALGTTVLPSKVTNDAGQSTGIKGRLNFSQGGTPPYDVITIYDSLPETTAVTPSTGQLGVNRPLADAGDGAICLDGASSNSGSVCLRGQAINFYLNRLADGTSWAMGMSDLFYSTSTALAGGIQIRVPFGTGTSGNTDNAGAGTLSSGSPGTFGYTFTGTYVSAPTCVATDTLHPLAVQATSTTTRLTVTGTGSDTINYVCTARN